MKKILALVLVLSLVLGTFSFAFAATPEDVVDTDYEEAVETLMALGVVNGYPDGTYKPEKTLTRAEMAKLLVEALGYGDLAAGTSVKFSDTQGHWAQDYIGFAAAMDIVLGYPDGTFGPDRTMTMDEAVTMVVRALGYEDSVLKGSWPTNYKVKALDLGLTEDVTVSGEAGRGDVAIVLHNALEVRLVEVIKDANGLFTYEYIDSGDRDENNNIIYKVLLDQIGDKDEMEVKPDDVWGDDALDVADGVDLEQYLFNTVTYYSTDDYDVAYVSDMEYDMVMGTLVDNDDDVLTVEDADEEEYELEYDNDSKLYYNGDDAEDTEIEDLMADYTDVTVVYNDDDEVLGVVAWEFEVDQMNSDYNARRETKLNGVTGWDLPDDDGDLDVDALTVEGAVDSVEDIEEDDVVYYYASDDVTKVKLVVVRDTFEGRFTQRSSDGSEGTFGGEAFDVSFASDLDLGEDAELGDTYVLYLDKDGDIFALELEDEADGTESYAVYIESDGGSLDDDRWGEWSVDETPVVKLLTDGGDLVIYDLSVEDLEDEDLEDGTESDLGAIDLEIDGDDILLDTSLEEGDLVEVEMNDDGEITNVVAVGTSYDDDEYDEDDMTVDGYDVTDDTVIFDLTADDSDDWDVVSVNQLTEDIAGYMEVDSLEVLAMTVTEGLEDTDTVLAVLLDVDEYYDGDDVVEELTVWIEGEEETVYTDDDYDTEDLLDDVEEDGVVVELEFSGDEVVDVDAADADAVIRVESVDSRRVSSASDVYKYGDSFAVYVVEDDEFMVGDYNDILEDDVVQLFLDADGEVEVLVLDLDDQDLPEELDTEDLEDAKDAAADLNEEDYTAESWADLEDALALPETTQAKVDAKTAAIWDAIDALVEVEEPAEVTAEYEAKLNSITQTYAIRVLLSDTSLNDSITNINVDGTDYEPGSELNDGSVLVSGSFEVEPTTVIVTVDGELITATEIAE